MAQDNYCRAEKNPRWNRVRSSFLRQQYSTTRNLSNASIQQRLSARQCYVHGRWIFPSARTFFRDTLAKKPLTDCDYTFAPLIMSVRPQNRSKSIAIAPGILPPQCGEVAVSKNKVFSSRAQVERVGQFWRVMPHMTRYCPRRAFFGHNTTNFIKGLFSS